ncbi:MAG: pyrroline-5-carboxylate reductase family protein, partial [Aeromonadaceae bacterium]
MFDSHHIPLDHPHHATRLSGIAPRATDAQHQAKEPAMDQNIAFIGSGNMGKAIIGGIINSQLTAASNLHVYDIDANKCREMEHQFAIKVTSSAEEAAAVADILFIAVKPNIIPGLLPQLKPHLKPGCIVISIAAGVTLATLEQGLSGDHKIVRVMPNTPALVNCGMSSITPNAN